MLRLVRWLPSSSRLSSPSSRRGTFSLEQASRSLDEEGGRIRKQDLGAALTDKTDPAPTGVSQCKLLGHSGSTYTCDAPFSCQPSVLNRRLANPLLSTVDPTRRLSLPTPRYPKSRLSQRRALGPLRSSILLRHLAPSAGRCARATQLHFPKGWWAGMGKCAPTARIRSRS